MNHPKEELPEGFKRCCKCKQVKPITEFGKLSKAKDGLKYDCKECRSKQYQDHSEIAKARSRKRYRNNKEEISQKNKEYKAKRAEWYREYTRQYYAENKETIKENVKQNHYNRIQNDPGYKLLYRCRKRIYEAVKNNRKAARTQELIGCTTEQLLGHLESQFKEGMTWNNYGEWHIDHIKPCALFDFTKEEEQRECFHYTNLQPLWAKENMEKSDKYEEAI